MTDETLQRLAREAGLTPPTDGQSWGSETSAGISMADLARFAALVRADERERCAKEAEHWQKISTTPGHACGQYIAAAIRALKDKP